MGFSQKEIAFLLNCQHGTAVSRYERRIRKPSLETAIALEIIFSTPLRELYAGVYDEVEQIVVKRLNVSVKTLQKSPKSERVEHKLAALNEILRAIAR